MRHARRLIFDLDTTIQALWSGLGETDPETVKLTGIYDNLSATGPKYEYVIFSRDTC